MPRWKDNAKRKLKEIEARMRIGKPEATEVETDAEAALSPLQKEMRDHLKEFEANPTIRVLFRYDDEPSNIVNLVEKMEDIPNIPLQHRICKLLDRMVATDEPLKQCGLLVAPGKGFFQDRGEFWAIVEQAVRRQQRRMPTGWAATVR